MLTITEEDTFHPDIKQWVKENFATLCVRIGKAKNHAMKTQFIPDVTPIQQKGRRIPIHLQERVEKTQQTNRPKNIIKLEKCSDKQFINPIVITVKKDQTVKLALDSKKINKFLHKNKYQMPNIDLLLDKIAQTIKFDTKEQILFSSLDLRYAYSQIPLDKKRREQCNFSLFGGNATGTYQFQTGVYILTDMLAEFQKAIDLTLTNCKNTYAYLDDILIITKRSVEKHKETLEKKPSQTG